MNISENTDNSRELQYKIQKESIRAIKTVIGGLIFILALSPFVPEGIVSFIAGFVGLSMLEFF